MITPLPTTSGLWTPSHRHPVPLQRVDVSAAVGDVAATVTLRQVYRNAEQTPLEVVYVFPLDEGAAVCGFEATVDGVKYVGTVQEREEAFRRYDDAIEAGHGGFLLDEERPDVFTASLGNLAPGREVELSLTYVTELASEGTGLRFTLPTTVSPRYAPGEDRVGVGRTQADALNPPVEPHVPYRFTFEMQVEAVGPITRVESPSHPITAQISGQSAKVTLSQRDAAMDRDLVILLDAEGANLPHAWCEQHDSDVAAVVSFLPVFPASQRPAEVIFLIDRSGSMDGTSIEEVRNALQLCLRSLSAGCRFNIVGFGSTHEALFEDSRDYDDDSLRAATDHVSHLRADLGGTEILPALQHVLEGPHHDVLPREIVLLTDGEVTNTDAVIALARKHAATTRIFTFGIGAGASQHLVRAVARVSGGAAEFVAPGERIEAKVLRQFRRVLAPALRDVRVQWPGTGWVQAPDAVPPAFDGERLRVYALGTSLTAGTAILTGTLSATPFRAEVPLNVSTARPGRTIGRLAARARIRELEEGPGFLEARGSRQQRSRGPSSIVEEIVALGLRYQLCSRETSFVAIEHREVPLTEPMELRRVPVLLTNGWGASDRRAMAPVMSTHRRPAALDSADMLYCLGAAMSPAPPPVAEMRAPGPGRAPQAQAKRRGPSPAGAPSSRLDGIARQLVGGHRVDARRDTGSRRHDTLVRLQHADGTWDLDAELARAIGKPLSDLTAALRDCRGSEDEAARALATALALAWLRSFASDARDEWSLIASKGEAWLRGCLAKPAEPAPNWMVIAERLL